MANLKAHLSIFSFFNAAAAGAEVFQVGRGQLSLEEVSGKRVSEWCKSQFLINLKKGASLNLLHCSIVHKCVQSHQTLPAAKSN